MDPNRTWQPLSAASHRRCWAAFLAVAAAHAACAGLAMGTRGLAAQLFAGGVFVSSFAVYGLSMRLLDHYEGEGHDLSRTGSRIRYGAYALAVAVWLAALAGWGGLEEKTLKALVFLSLFLNFWTAFGVFLGRDAEAERQRRR